MRSTPPQGPLQVRWLDVSSLTDPSRCPACAAPLARQRCGACGLDVAGPRGRALWDMSQEASGTLSRRSALIREMRATAATPVAPARAVMQSAPVMASTPIVPARSPYAPNGVSAPPRAATPQTAPRQSLPQTVPHPVPARPAPQYSPPRPTPARPGWAVQTILLVLGATLLAGAGLVFTVFAWGMLPLPARGLILAGIAAAVFTGAWYAARANLRSSAEAIAALGSALVVLVAWVLWAAVLPGGTGGAVAMAGALLVAAVVLVPLGRALRLATPSVIGLVSLTLAPAVLAAGSGSAPAASLLLALAAAMCVVGRHPLVADAAAARTPGGPPVAGPSLAGPPPAGPPSTWPAPAWPAPAAPARVAPGPVTLGHARSVLTALAPIYLSLSALVLGLSVLTTIPDSLLPGSAQTIAPLAGIAVASGLWAWMCAHRPAGQSWSAVAGTSLALLGGALAVALPARPGALLWLLPLGVAVGVALTVGTLRALPRLDASAVQAGWVVFLVTGILPGAAVLRAVLAVLASPQASPGGDTPLDVLHALAGLVVMGGAAPLLHRLGGHLLAGSARTVPALPVPASPGAQAQLLAYAPLPRYPGAPATGRFVVTARQRGPFSAHTWGVSVVAAAFLLLGLPAAIPSPLGAASGWLVLAAVVSVVGTRLSVRAPDAGSVPASLGGPVRLAPLALACVQAFSAAAVVVATVLSFSLADGADVSVSGEGGRAMVAASFVVAGLVLWVARAWVPSDVGNRAALLFGSLVIASVGVGILARLVVPLTSVGWYAAPFPLLVVLVVLLSGRRGAARPLGLDRLAALAAVGALLVPGLVVGASIAVTATTAEPGQPLVSSVISTAMLVTTIALAWLLAFADRSPAPGWLRATAGTLLPVLAVGLLLSLRPIAAALDVPLADLDWSLAVLGLLAALITVAGAVRTQDRAARLASEVAVAVLAVVTTCVVVTQGPPSRVAIALVICAAGTLAFAVVSGRPRWGWLALGLAVVASWVSLDGTTLPPEAYTAPGGLVVVAVGLWQVVSALRADRDTGQPIRVLVAGLVVLVLPTAVLAPGSTGEVRAVVVAVCIVWLGLTAQLLSMSVQPRLRPLALPFAVLALVGAVVGLGGRAAALAGQVADQLATGSGDQGPTTQRTVLIMALWTAAAVAGTALLAVHVTRTRYPRTAPVSLRPEVLVGDPRVWAPTVCTLLLTAPVGILVARGAFETATVWVAAALVAVWGVAALLGTPPGAPRVRSHLEFIFRTAPAVAGAYVTVLLSATALSSSGTSLVTGRAAVFALLTCAGIVVAAVGVRAAQVAPASSTWRTVSVGALATIVPPTLAMFDDPSGWWITVAIVTAAAWLILGVSLRWQAPVGCGGVALAVQVVVLAGPPALAALSGILGWVVLASVGGVLLALGLTFERQMTTARTVLRRYSELR